MSRLLCQLSYTALRAKNPEGKPPAKENDRTGRVVPPPDWPLSEPLYGIEP